MNVIGGPLARTASRTLDQETMTMMDHSAVMSFVDQDDALRVVLVAEKESNANEEMEEKTTVTKHGNAIQSEQQEPNHHLCHNPASSTLAPYYSRQATRMWVGMGSACFFLLFHLISFVWYRKRLAKQRRRHTCNDDFADSSLLFDDHTVVSWMERHCQGKPARIRLLEQLLWFRTIHSTPSSSKGTSSPRVLPDSWRLLLLDCIARDDFLLNDGNILIKVIAALGICHVPQLVWPACVVDVLVRCVLTVSQQSSINNHAATEAASLARIRGRLAQMGIISACQQQHEHDPECYFTTNILSWDKNVAPTNNLAAAAASLWKAHFAQTLQASLLVHPTVQPLMSMREKMMLYSMLPALFVNLGYPQRAIKMLLDPFVVHCRLEASMVASPQEARQFADPLNPYSGNAHYELVEDLGLLHAHALWKQRCCRQVAKHDGVQLTVPYQKFGLHLLHHRNNPRLVKAGWLCMEEARRLQIKQLTIALQGVMNALRYIALVLWSVGRPQDKRDKTLSPKRILSRRIFALQKDLQSSQPNSNLQAWVTSVKAILGETSVMDHFDIQQGHGRLQQAVERMEVALKLVLEISSLFSNGEPDLVNE